MSATRRVTVRRPRGGPRTIPLVVGALIAGAVAARGVSAPDPAAGAGWQALPPAPIDLASVQTGVWTGREALFTMPGKDTRPAAAFNPATRSWRALPGPGLAPLAEGHDHSAWTGREMVIVGGFREQEVGGVVQSVDLADAAAYNPATRRWRRLPSLPTGRRDATAEWDGRDVLVAGGFVASSRPPYRRLLSGVFAYRPTTNRWRRLRPLPHGRDGQAAVWTGARMLVWGGEVKRDGTARADGPVDG